MRNAAVEIYGRGNRRPPIIVTCEHACAKIPRPLKTTREDRPWLETHWALDIGAATVSREITRRTGSLAILSRFSRLVCDPNRPVDDPVWARDELEGHALSFNQELDHDERTRRRRVYWDPYHDTIDDTLAQRLALGGDVLLLAVHSFTPKLDSEVRTMELGILFDQHDAVALRFQQQLDHAGFSTALNEPYSGLGGMIFAVNRHGRMHGVVYLEIEIRQDLIDTAPKARVTGRRIAGALDALMIRGENR